MASTTENNTRRVETAIPMTRFSISEDDDDRPLVVKRPRLSEEASQSRRSVQRSRSCVAADEDPEEVEVLRVEDVDSDSQGSGEEDSGSEDDDDDEESEDEEREEEFEVRENIESDASTDCEPVLEGQNQQRQIASPAAPSSLRGQSNIAVAHRTASSSSPVPSSANGELQVVLSDSDVLDCPICFDPLCTPVFQCENGHIACSSCCSKVNRKCPSCCMPIGYNRCRAIEKVVESIKISCKNAQHGCKETMAYSKKLEHEKTCPHTACFCPHPSCPFTGSSKSMYLHFGIQHAASAIRFTYHTDFTVRLTRSQKHIFLQEQHESVVFILNHQATVHGLALNIDCVGPNPLKTAFWYYITAKNKEVAVSLQGAPEMYTNWSEHALKRNYLMVPPDFGNTSLHVCIKKVL